MYYKFLLNKYNSIVVKVTLLFIFACISFGSFVLYFIHSEQTKKSLEIEAQYHDISSQVNILASNLTIDEILNYLVTLGLEKISDEDVANQTIENKLDILVLRSNPFIENGTKRVKSNVITINDNLYLLVQDDNKDIYIFKNNFHYNFDGQYILILIAFITLIFFYVLVLKSLLPLMDLHKSVKKFAAGDTHVTIPDISSGDEVQNLADAFKEALDRINALNKSRMLFLRSIMHELKTPLTKGLLITEMLPLGKSKQRLTKAFKRLDSIINEFAKLEEIGSKNYSLSKSTFTITELIKAVDKMLLLEDERPRNILLLNREAVLEADFEMLCLSVKNLADNALKFSIDEVVFIDVKDDSLIVSNRAEPFKTELSNYFSPFYNDGEENKLKGLGLGMYIIKSTVEAQDFALDYNYDKGMHYFFIRGCVKHD